LGRVHSVPHCVKPLEQEGAADQEGQPQKMNEIRIPMIHMICLDM
jgi:hypothetical protein